MRFIVGLAVAFVACVYPVPAQAQSGPTQKGSMLVGGSANFTRSSTSGQSTTSIGVQPMMLYFIANRIAIGGELGLNYADHTNGETTSWRLGPATRIYFAERSRTLVYLGAALLIGSATTSATAPIADSDQSIRAIEGVAGLTFMFSRQVGLAGELFTDRSKNTLETASGNEVSTTITHYGVRFGIAAFVF